MGLVALLRWSLAIHSVCFVITPFSVSAVSAASATVQWAVVAPVYIVRTLAQVGQMPLFPARYIISMHRLHRFSQVCAFTCIFVTVANAALPRDRSAVNGLGQAGSSIARAVMPPLGTALFALSVRTPNAPWPLNWHAVWLLLAASSAGLLALSHRLPPWIETKRRDDLA